MDFFSFFERRAVFWYLVYSFLCLLVYGVMAALIILGEPFHQYQGALVYTNHYGEGLLEAVMLLIALPGWVLIAYNMILSFKEVYHAA